jgi:hypothetical protein
MVLRVEPGRRADARTTCPEQGAPRLSGGDGLGAGGTEDETIEQPEC